MSHTGAYNEAELAFCSMLKLHDENVQEIDLARAYNYSWVQKEKAKRVVQTILENERSPDALLGLAYTLHFNHEDAMAIPLFKEVIQLDKNNISAWKGIFHAARQLNKTALAFHAINQLLIMEPDHADHHYEKAELSYSNRHMAAQSRSSHMPWVLIPRTRMPND